MRIELRALFVTVAMIWGGQAVSADAPSRYTGDGERVDFAIERMGDIFTLYLAAKEGNVPLKDVVVSLVPDDESEESLEFRSTETEGVYSMTLAEGVSFPEGSLVVKGSVSDEVEVYAEEMNHSDHGHENHDHSHGDSVKSKLPPLSPVLLLTLGGFFGVGLIFGRLSRRSSAQKNTIPEAEIIMGSAQNAAEKVSMILLIVGLSASSWFSDAAADEGHTHDEMSIETKGKNGEIFVSKKSQFLLGMRTAHAEKQPVEKGFQAFGHATAAPMLDAVVKAPATGIFRTAKSLTVGMRVKKDEILGYIDGLGSIPVRAPIAGSLLSLDIYQGLRAESGANLFRITDTRFLWIDAEVFQKDLGAIRHADKILVTIDGREPVSGRLTTLKTEISEQTLTGKVFIEIENRDESVALGSVGSVSFVSKAKEGKSEVGYVLPRSAVLARGAETIVFLQTGPETFEQRTVVVEPTITPDRLHVRAGLENGDRIVVTGNYQLLTAAH